MSSKMLLDRHWQEKLQEDLLRKIEGVTLYFNDVLIYAPSLPVLYKKVRDVLQICRKEGVRAKRDKCLIGLGEIDSLG